MNMLQSTPTQRCTLTAPEQDVGEIPRILGYMDNNIGELEDAFLKLAEKLATVVSVSKEPMDKSVELDSITPLGRRLVSLNTRLLEVKRTITFVTSIIEL